MERHRRRARASRRASLVLRGTPTLERGSVGNAPPGRPTTTTAPNGASRARSVNWLLHARQRDDVTSAAEQARTEVATRGTTRPMTTVSATSDVTRVGRTGSDGDHGSPLHPARARPSPGRHGGTTTMMETTTITSTQARGACWRTLTGAFTPGSALAPRRDAAMRLSTISTGGVKLTFCCRLSSLRRLRALHHRTPHRRDNPWRQVCSTGSALWWTGSSWMQVEGMQPGPMTRRCLCAACSTGFEPT
jgi:hypothetical protein